MSRQWHYSKQKQRFGPITDEHLQSLAQSGQLHPGDLVWTKGMANWMPAQTISGLQFAAAVPRLPRTAGPVDVSPLGFLDSLQNKSVATEERASYRRSYSAPRRSPIRKKNAAMPYIIVGVVVGALIVVGAIVNSQSDSGRSATISSGRQPGRSLDGAAGSSRGAPSTADDLPTYTGPLPPKRDYSKGPNGEVPVPFILYMVKDDRPLQIGSPHSEYRIVESLNGHEGIAIHGHQIVFAGGHRVGPRLWGPDGNHVYHGKITVTNEIGDLDSPEVHEVALSFCLRGKAEMHFWAGMPEGTLRLWYPSGKKWIELPYVGGKRNGLATTWYENGNRVSEVVYVDNEPDGLWTAWYRSGQLWHKTRYTHGIRESVTRWDEDGTLLYKVSGSMDYLKGYEENASLADDWARTLSDSDRYAKESLLQQYRTMLLSGENSRDELVDTMEKWQYYHPHEPNEELQSGIDFWNGKCDGLRETMAKHGYLCNSLAGPTGQ